MPFNATKYHPAARKLFAGCFFVTSSRRHQKFLIKWQLSLSARRFSFADLPRP